MNEEHRRTTIDISTVALIKIIIAILAFIFLRSIIDVIVLFFIVLVIVAALNPIVERWEREMPRKLAVVLLYLIGVLIIVAAGLLVTRPLVEQIQQLANNLPSYLKYISPSLHDFSTESQRTLLSLSSQLSNVGLNILNTTIGFVSGIVVAFTVVVLSFYLLMDQQGVKKFFTSVVPSEKREDIAEIISKIGDKMGAWLRGQLTLMIIVGILISIGLAILGNPYYLTLGLWAGLTELIAYVGPILGFIPAVLIAFTISPLNALLTLILFIVVQQIEAQFLVPKIMGKAVGLSPVIIIFAILIGAKLLGILGVILSVPAAGSLAVLIEEYPKIKQVLSKD